MKKYISKLVLTLIVSINLFGQNYIYVGDDRYEATESWEFALNGSSWTGILNVQVAKTEFGGYLWLSTRMNSVSNDYIGGNIKIYLDDGSTITCVDRKIRDRVNDEAITLYKFTRAEMDILKRKRIHTIRLKIYHPYYGIYETSVESNNVTADNKEKYYNIMFGEDAPMGKYKTELSIMSLFN